MFSRRHLATLALGLGLTVLWARGAAGEEAYRLSVTKLDASDFPDVRVVVSVTDASGKPVRGLTDESLVVLERGAPQSAEVQLSSLVAPVALVLALDTSGSMWGQPIADAKRAIGATIQALGPLDRAAVLTFSATPRVAQALTGDHDALLGATNAAVASGDTAIYDAVAVATDLLAQADPKARRAIVLLTDGVDTASRADRAEVLRRVGQAGYPVFVVGLGRDLDRTSLQQLAEAGPGGRLLVAPTSSQLAAIYAALSEQLLTQYAVHYRSIARALAGESLAVELRLVRGKEVLAATSATFRVPVGRGAASTRTPLPVVTPTSQAVLPQQSPDAVLVGLLGAATTLTFLLWIAELAGSSPLGARRRLREYVADDNPEGAGAAPRASIVRRLFLPSLHTIGGALSFVTPSALLASTRARLIQAGGPLGLGPVEFVGVRVGSAMVASVVVMAIATATHPQPAIFLAAGASGVLLGFAIPGFVLHSMARRRQSEIRRALPAALDMLALSVEAGLAFDGAIAQVAQRWHTPLSEEFRKLLVEFQMGRDRRQALREMAERTGLPEFMRFATAVVQADSFGVPLSKVLQDQAVEMRTRRRQRAEELARQAPIKMLFPMMLLIFPALFVVVLGPAVPRLLSIFNVSH